MRKNLTAIVFASAALGTLALGGCGTNDPTKFISATNPFVIKIGSLPPLTFTGNLGNDMPAINTFNAALAAGVKADLPTIKGALTTFCQYVPTAQGYIPAVQQAIASNQLPTTGVITQTAAQKQVSNAATGLGDALSLCNAGTQVASAATLQQKLQAGVAAWNTVVGLYNQIRS